MPAWLAALGIKDLVYGTIIAAILAGFGWYTHHEQVVGAEKVIKLDTTVAAAATVKIEAAETVAKNTEQKIGDDYAKAVAAPAVAAAPHRVRRLPSLKSLLPAASCGNPSAPSPPVGGEAATGSVEDESAILTIGRGADAMILALQAENANLRNEMKAGK